MPYVCPDNCEGFQENPQLYILPGCLIDTRLGGDHPEMGVQCDSDGKMTNMWYDGTVGVPDYIEDDDCPPHCWHCGEEAMWAEFDETDHGDLCPCDGQIHTF